MKNVFKFMQTYLVISCCFLIVSCSGDNRNASKDSKETAESHNDAKFNSSEEEDDAQFLVDAYSKNLFEIELSKHAKEKSARKDVEELAGRIIASDVRMNEELEKLAGKRQVSLQQGITNEQLDKIKEYGEKTGDAFDKSYLDKVAECHEKMLERSEKLIDNTTDSDLHNMISSSLPELRKHLDEILTLKDHIK